MKLKRVLVLIFAVVMIAAMVSCGEIENDDSNGSTGALNEQREAAKLEIDNYQNKISSSLSDDGKEYVEYVKSIYVPAIEERTDGIDDLKQICLLKMEQTLIRDTQDFEIEKVNAEYDPAIDNVCSWLDNLLDEGIYRDTEENYNTEIEAVEEQLRDIAIEKSKKKDYYARMCAWNGYSQSWLQSKYSEVDAEHRETYDNLVAQKEYLQALWANREKYDEYLALLGGLEEERDVLIAEINEEYDLKYQELGQQISELEK